MDDKDIAAKLGNTTYYYGPNNTVIDQNGNPAPDAIATALLAQRKPEQKEEEPIFEAYPVKPQGKKWEQKIKDDIKKAEEQEAKIKKEREKKAKETKPKQAKKSKRPFVARLGNTSYYYDYDKKIIVDENDEPAPDQINKTLLENYEPPEKPQPEFKPTYYGFLPRPKKPKVPKEPKPKNPRRRKKEEEEQTGFFGQLGKDLLSTAFPEAYRIGSRYRDVFKKGKDKNTFEKKVQVTEETDAINNVSGVTKDNGELIRQQLVLQEKSVRLLEKIAATIGKYKKGGIGLGLPSGLDLPKVPFLLPGIAIIGSILASAFAGWTLWKQGTGQEGSWTDPKNPRRFEDPSMPFGHGSDEPGANSTPEIIPNKKTEVPKTIPGAATPKIEDAAKRAPTTSFDKNKLEYSANDIEFNAKRIKFDVDTFTISGPTLTGGNKAPVRNQTNTSNQQGTGNSNTSTNSEEASSKPDVNASPGTLKPIKEGNGQGHTASREERVKFAREYAESKGLNPDSIQATMEGEGLNIYVGDHGTSFGDFQLHVGGGSMGDQAIAHGIDIRNPDTWKEQAKYAIDQMAAHKNDPKWLRNQWHGMPGWAAQGMVKSGITPTTPEESKKENVPETPEGPKENKPEKEDVVPEDKPSQPIPEQQGEDKPSKPDIVKSNPSVTPSKPEINADPTPAMYPAYPEPQAPPPSIQIQGPEAIKRWKEQMLSIQVPSSNKPKIVPTRPEDLPATKPEDKPITPEPIPQTREINPTKDILTDHDFVGKIQGVPEPLPTPPKPLQSNSPQLPTKPNEFQTKDLDFEIKKSSSYLDTLDFSHFYPQYETLDPTKKSNGLRVW